MSKPPTPAELWLQAKQECPLSPEDRARGVTVHVALSDRFRELMREHEHLIPGVPTPLPCGWPLHDVRDTP